MMALHHNHSLDSFNLFVLTAFHKTVTSMFYKAHENKALMEETVKHKGKKC